MSDQNRTPLLEAMIAYIESKPAAFDVPGHKMGNLTNDFSDYAGKKLYECDINAPIGLDNLYHPNGCIKEAEELFAEVFKADKAIFSVNGTSGGIMTMIVGVINAKEKIILPRNVHKSVINALIMSGGIPIFVKPNFDSETGIANGVRVEDYVAAMDANPDAKAIFVINPTYFGFVSNLKEIVKEAHARNVIVICDEAHGSHLYFSSKLPKGAMQVGADISCISMHKTGGSLTQSSVILMKVKRISYSRILKVFSMFSSTSPSHLLLASLDAARKKMFFEGKYLVERARSMAIDARRLINKISGLSCLSKENLDGDGCFDFDETRIVIDVTNLGLTGFDVFKIMRRDHNIQLELGEVSEVLAIVSIGTTLEDMVRLVTAFKDISRKNFRQRKARLIPHFSYILPEQVVRPREAFHAASKIITLEKATGEICAESIMIYPPGIPFLIPGEVISEDVLKLLSFYEEQGGVILSDSPEGYIKVIDQAIWYRGSDLDYDF